MLSGFVVVVVLQHFKMKLSYAMLITSCYIGALLGLKPRDFLISIRNVITTVSILKILGIIVLIMSMAVILRESGSLDKLILSATSLIKYPRVLLILIPAVIGMLPMPGGAMFSAPIVEKASSKYGVTREKQMIVNYWFRHIMEFSWPLYVSLIMESALLGVKLNRIISYQVIFTVVALILGIIFILIPVKIDKPSTEMDTSVMKSSKALYLFLKSLWPIIAVITLTLVFKTDLFWTLLAIDIFAILYYKRPISDMLEGFKLDTILLIISVFFFKNILESSGALNRVPLELETLHLPPYFILFLIPFLGGLLMGVTQASVGMSFPILMPIITSYHSLLPTAAFVLVSGVVGVLFSPAHFCLNLTKDYFNVSLSRVYGYLWKPLGLVLLFSFGMMMIS